MKRVKIIKSNDEREFEDRINCYIESNLARVKDIKYQMQCGDDWDAYSAMIIIEDDKRWESNSD